MILYSDCQKRSQAYEEYERCMQEIRNLYCNELIDRVDWLLMSRLYLAEYQKNRI